MSKELLVKRLKGVADNSELPYLNGLRINYSSGYEPNNRVISFYVDNASLKIISEHPVKVYIGTTLVGDDVTNITTPEFAGDQIYIQFPDNNGICDVISKFDINTIGYNLNHPDLGTRSGYTSFCIDMSQLYYCNNIREFFTWSTNFKGTLNPEKLENLVIFNTTNMYADTFDSYKMDITKLSNIISLTSLNCKGSKLVYGNLESLGTLVNLNTLTLWGTGVSGDLKTLCDSLVTHGKTSGTLTFDAASRGGRASGVITWNGEELTYVKIKELNNGGNQFNLKVEFGSSYTGGYRIVPLAE